jgi:hypothetical protein
MTHLYHKVAVASVYTVLSFVLGTSEEVKAATITVPPTIQFGVRTVQSRYVPSRPPELSSSDEFSRPDGFDLVGSPPPGVNYKRERLAEFNISSLFMAPNTIIKSAVFQDKLSRIIFNTSRSPLSLGIFGYIGNGTAEASDIYKGVFLRSLYISSLSPGDILNFDVTTFVNQQVNNNNPFAGFSLEIFANPSSSSFGEVSLEGTDALGRSSLVIETVEVAEPVPEPNTIFGSALALSLGGWLKRKKLSPQNKTPSQG